MDQTASNPLLSPPELSPLEQEVLEEYERLAENMKKASTSSSPLLSSLLASMRLSRARDIPKTQQSFASILDTMAGQPTTEILDGLRELERKTSLVFTLLKASVYSIVLQQEIDFGDNHDDQQRS
ncbi:DASH complex subunit Dad3-domain-containing protein [Xylaria sp. FL0933]|nr:DASH complex subunit Dad3-domain-containing protein [Xylaria sp. FL0933]